MINACHYLRGGSEIVYFNTAKLLASYGHEVAFFSSSDPRNEKTGYGKYFVDVGNIRELSLPGKIRMVPAYLYNSDAAGKLKHLILDFKPDVAHVHIFYGILSVSVLKVLNKYRIPVVHTVHDYRLLCPVNTLVDASGKSCELCKDRHFYHCIIKRCSDGNFFQSTMVALEAYFWKYVFNPVKLIDNFIFVSHFSKQKHFEFNYAFSEKFSQIYNFTDFPDMELQTVRGDYFLYFGRLSVEKGIKTLISAFTENKNSKLKIAGTGPLKEFVEASSKTSSNIEYVGFRKGKDLEELIRNASFIILPSECYENNPMAIVEAYCLGKPAIGSEVAGIPELIENGKNGYLFRLGDVGSLRKAISDSLLITDEEYENFSKSVHSFSKLKFDMAGHYLSLIEVYKSVIDKKKSEQAY
ncbi:MAG: glycosyltransferase family 4 protein [Bacteroidales bacterium]|nr:glycosyltransferase family 4 protein [Bacteroidales bacterium]